METALEILLIAVIVMLILACFFGLFVLIYPMMIELGFSGVKKNNRGNK